MSSGNLAFLILIVVAYGGFMVTLAAVSLYVRGAGRSGDARGGTKFAPPDRADDE